jgi:hypothetical protein
MYEQIIREATKDLIGKPLDQDTLVERLTEVLMKVIPKPQLEGCTVSTEDGRKYDFVFPLDTSCHKCGCPVQEPHPQRWGMFICAECGS